MVSPTNQNLILGSAPENSRIEQSDRNRRWLDQLEATPKPSQTMMSPSRLQMTECREGTIIKPYSTRKFRLSVPPAVCATAYRWGRPFEHDEADEEETARNEFAKCMQSKLQMD